MVFIMKKNLLFTASMLACLTFAMAGCQNGEAKPTKPNTVVPTNPTEDKPGVKVDTISFEAAYDASVLSGIGLLNSGVSTNALMGYKVSLMADETVESGNKDSKPEDSKTEAKPEDNKTEAKPEDNKANGLDKLNDSLRKEILDNLAIANSTLNGDSAKSEVKKSDRPEWEEMYTITQKDISGNDVVYTFYYTETLGDEEEEKEAKAVLASDKSSNEENVEDSKTDEKPEAKPEEKPEAKPEEEEIEKHIKGVVVVQDKEFEVSGDREIEADEQSVTYKIMLDKAT